MTYHMTTYAFDFEIGYFKKLTFEMARNIDRVFKFWSGLRFQSKFPSMFRSISDLLRICSRKWCRKAFFSI